MTMGRCEGRPQGGGTKPLIPPPSAAGSSIWRVRIAAHRTGAVASLLGKRKAVGPARIVGAAARAAISRRIGAG